MIESQGSISGVSVFSGRSMSGMLMDEKGFILIGVIVRRSAQALTVWLKGSGSLRYHATAMDAQRLALDFPGGRSVLQQSMMAVHHPLLARIRIGTDRRGLRVVFETESRIRYAIRPRPQALAIQFQPARKR